MAPRLTTAALALAGAAPIALVSILGATSGASPVAGAAASAWIIPAVLSGAGIGLLALGLAVPHQGPLGLGVGLLGAAFLVALPQAEPWRPLAPLAGGWLLGVAELAYWSVDLEIVGRDDRGVLGRRARLVAGVVAVGAVVSIAPETALNPAGLDGVWLTVAGLVAVAAIVAVAAVMAWRLRDAR